MGATRHAKFVRRLGGYAHLASQLGLARESVRSWCRPSRGIPSRYWHKLARLDPKLTPELLEKTRWERP
jgi:hypothetical protein